MSNITPAKRTHENILLAERKRLKHTSCSEKDCSMRIRSQQITFHSLPEDILSIIVSRLTLKEAVRTSVVSSNWRHIWECHPNLGFDISSVLGSKAKRKRSSDQRKRMLRKKFIDRIPEFRSAPLVFSHLKHLALRVQMFGKTTAIQLAYLLEAAPFLEDLHLDMYCFRGFDYTGGVLDMIVDRPHYHLKTACMTGFCGNRGQIELAKYIMRNAVELERMTIDPRGIMLGRFVSDESYGRMYAESELARSEEARGLLTIL